MAMLLSLIHSSYLKGKSTQWGQEHCVNLKPLTYAYANGFVFCGQAYKDIATAVIFSLRSCKASRN